MYNHTLEFEITNSDGLARLLEAIQADYYKSIAKDWKNNHFDVWPVLFHNKGRIFIEKNFTRGLSHVGKKATSTPCRLPVSPTEWLGGGQKWGTKDKKHLRRSQSKDVSSKFPCLTCSWSQLRAELGQQGDQSSQRKSILKIHWKDWCWSWSSNTLATWCEELTHWKRPWCWERSKAKEKEAVEDEMVR